MEHSRLYYLLQQQMSRSLLSAEEAELQTIINDPAKHQETLLVIDKIIMKEGEHPKHLDPALEQIYFNNIIRIDKGESTPVHRVHFLRTAFFRYAAAIIMIFGIGAYLWNQKLKVKSGNLKVVENGLSKNDILPGSQKAILTLADGRQIILDSVNNGQIALENGSEIEKRNGEIIYGEQAGKNYNSGQLNNNAVAYNTMSTPKGGQYQLTLSDGTKVWLNAASKIIYPAVFSGITREVKLEGEAYFKVATNAKMPFIVKTNSEEIQVLGTEFNVSAYQNETEKTSLIQGSVKVKSIFTLRPSKLGESGKASVDKEENILQPGQAFVNGKIITTNIEQDIAWKNGIFNFDLLSIQDVTNQLARWYDVEIKIEENARAAEFRGKMGRNLSLQQVLRGLEGIEGLHFELKEKTLIVRR